MKHSTTYKVSLFSQKKFEWKKLREFKLEKQARDFAKTIRNKMNTDTVSEKVISCKTHNSSEDVEMHTYYSKERKF